MQDEERIGAAVPSPRQFKCPTAKRQTGLVPAGLTAGSAGAVVGGKAGIGYLKRVFRAATQYIKLISGLALAHGLFT